jgi:hypothetical protein
MFTTAPVLAHFDHTLPIILETDASDFAIGAVLSQLHNKRLHPVAFYSRKMEKAEINYDIHDKEMLAIVAAFKEWSRYPESAIDAIMVYTDHKNLEYFCTTKVLNRRQARWAQELANYEFKICYRPGSKDGKPDALSRRSEYRPRRGGSSGIDENQPVNTLLRPSQFVSSLDTAYSHNVSSYRSSAFASDNETGVLCDGKTTMVTDRRSVANRYREWTIPEENHLPYQVNRGHCIRETYRDTSGQLQLPFPGTSGLLGPTGSYLASGLRPGTTRQTVATHDISSRKSLLQKPTIHP